MIALSLILATVSGIALLTGGYLLGARRGREVRATLSLINEHHQRGFEHQRAVISSLSSSLQAGAADGKNLEALLQPALAELEQKITNVAGSANMEQLRQELRATTRALAEQARAQDEGLRQELRSGLSAIGKQAPPGDIEKLRADIQKAIQPLVRQQADTTALRDALREMIAPMLERDRLGKELSSLEGGTSLAELPRMLDSIATKSGFSTVLLSDDVGLPLATNASARDVDVLAGIASFLLKFADRAERDGTSRPQAIVVFDESNQHVLHRIFAVDSSRFTLSAVSRGVHVAPSALDAALGKLERVLAKRAA